MKQSGRDAAGHFRSELRDRLHARALELYERGLNSAQITPILCTEIHEVAWCTVRRWVLAMGEINNHELMRRWTRSLDLHETIVALK